MRKRIYIIIAVIFACIISLVNIFFCSKYGVTLPEYYKSNKLLTQAEKAWLEEHGSISYAININAPPLNYLDEETKQYKGIFMDYLNSLSMEIGTDIDMESLSRDMELSDLLDGTIDIIDYYKSSNATDKLVYSNPIYITRGIMIVNEKTKDIKNVYHLQGKTIAIRKDDYSEEFLKRKKIDEKIIKVSNLKEGIALVAKGNADVVIGDEQVLSYLLHEDDYMDKLNIAGHPIYEKQVVLAASKDHAPLIPIINKTIFKLEKYGTMSKIQQKWLGVSEIHRYNEDKKMNIILFIVILITIVLAFIYLFYVINHSLKKILDKKTEELNKSRNELQAAFDVLGKIVIIVNSKGVILNVNKDFCKYIKMHKENVVNSNIKNLDSNLKNIWSTIEKNNYNNMNFEINYNKEFYEIYIRNINENDVNGDKLITVKNITTEKVSEKQMLQSHKMAAVGQLATGVAHEIRNPLGIIRNYSYLLKNKKINEDAYYKCIENIDSSVDRASKIIDNLLNFSSISGNNQKIINIKEFFESILELEKKVLEEKKISVNLYCHDTDINTNEESLKHIFINLITNAIDAMANGGNIIIFCAVVGEQLHIYFSDTGNGIPKEDLDNLFNPFFTTKDPGKGTGLGLFIVYNEVKKLGGNIDVISSEANKGTTFKVEIPTKGEFI